MTMPKLPHVHAGDPGVVDTTNAIISASNEHQAAIDALDRRTSRLSNQLTRHLEWCIREKGRVDRSLRNIAAAVLVTQFFVCVLAVVVAVVAS